MVDRPFRFGVICPKCPLGQGAHRAGARKAEALGYSTFFVPDHFVDHDLAPTVALAHVAAVTDTLRVGPFVLGNDYKHPVVLAREMATLDLLSDGRLELGIGAGWMTVDYEKAGHPARPAGRAHRPPRRVDRRPEGPVRTRAVHVPRRALPGHRPRRDAEAGAGRRPAVPRSAAAAARSSVSRRAKRRSSASTRTCGSGDGDVARRPRSR